LPLLAAATKSSELRPVNKALEIVNTYKPKRVLVIGMAYKPGQSITYKSPSIPYVNTLSEQGVDVHYYDPLVTYPSLARLADKDFTAEYLEATYDVICICMKQHKIDFSILKNVDKNKIVIY
jgi:UDP-N-acetyl-D-mannosaminuronate dehydrogenase